MKKYLLTGVLYLAISTMFIPMSLAQTWYLQGNVAGAQSSGANGAGGTNGNAGSATGTGNTDAGNGNASGSETNSQAPQSEFGSYYRQNKFEDISELRGMSSEDKQNLVDDFKSMKQAERCLIAQENISKRVDYYQNGNTASLSIFQGISNGVTNTVSRLRELGYNTENVEALQARLQLMISEMNTLQNRLTYQLMSAHVAACGDQAQYKEQVRTAQQNLTQLKSKVMEIKEFISNELKTSLQTVINSSETN